MAVGPDFGLRVFGVNERIVLGYAAVIAEAENFFRHVCRVPGRGPCDGDLRR